jgi:hypothetical protein
MAEYRDKNAVFDETVDAMRSPDPKAAIAKLEPYKPIIIPTAGHVGFESQAEKIRILSELKLMEISEITISFSGSGDDGNIDEIYVDGVAVNKRTETIVAHTESGSYVGGVWQSKEVMTALPLREIITRIADDILEKCGDDWVNNDGGFGEITIKLDTDEPYIHLDMNVRFTDSELHQYDY